MWVPSKSIFALITLSLAVSSHSTSAIEVTDVDNVSSVDHHLKFIEYFEAQRLVDGGVPPPLSMLHLRNDFVEWMAKFERVYESMADEFERMLIWVQNHEFIEEHNNQTPKPSFTVGHNQFSDMTNDEFQKMFSLGKYSPGTHVIKAAHKKNKEESAKRKVDKYVEEERNRVQAEFRHLRKLAAGEVENDMIFFDDKWWSDDTAGDTDDKSDSGDTDDTSGGGDDSKDDDDTNGLPDEVDWVKEGAVTEVKNQGSCGSCWAFSTTGSIEGAAFIKNGELVSLSEQNLIDCDSTDKGCMGGMMETAFKFDEEAHGLCSEVEYPYLATDAHTCNTNCTKVVGSVVADYLDIDEKDKHGLLASIALQPTSVAMQAGQLSFQLYSSGVFSDAECGATGDVDHGVLAVGYGTDEESGKKFFTIKNSWGDEWGENGYFRVDRKSKNEWGTCAILMIMTAPIMA